MFMLLFTVNGYYYKGKTFSAVENAAGIDVPERAHYIRSIIGELERIQSHLLWAGVAAHELGFDSGEDLPLLTPTDLSPGLLGTEEHERGTPCPVTCSGNCFSTGESAKPGPRPGPRTGACRSGRTSARSC